MFTGSYKLDVEESNPQDSNIILDTTLDGDLNSEPA